MSQTLVKSLIAKAGGPTALARKLGITSQAVSQWRRIPVIHVRAVAVESNLPVDAVLAACERPAREVVG